MRRHGWIAFVTLIALVAGCAGPTTSMNSSVSREDGSALARDLTGTWQGSYWQLGMVLYSDDADCTLQIKPDATFTATCTRSAVGTNNIAKSSRWSGRVVTKGHYVVLQDNGGAWPSIVLRRSSDGALYGATLDPLVGATVGIEFERESDTSASPAGQ